MSNSTFEWSWDNSPIMLPLKFENREWNAIHIAFFLAEYSGSTVNIMHVNSVIDSSEENEKFLNKLDHIATDLKVKYNVHCIGEKSVEPSITEIAHAIISESEKLGSQVIVMEHADIQEDWYQLMITEKWWDGVRKLVPLDWIRHV